MERVNVILSTYNGEQFLAQQLDSILEQTYPNVDVYIRDDGSSDRTVSIIKEYCGKSTDTVRFHLLEDQRGNLNTWRSFLCAIMASDDADYYAFCDQDDVWNPDKIERAVRVLSEQPKETPFLYAAGYDICDLSLNQIGKGKKTVPLEQMSVGKSFFNYGAGLGQGFTLVFNRALKEYAFYPEKMDIRGHDVWLWAVISGLREGYYYDDYSSASYRRHTSSVTPTGGSGWNLWRWRFRQFMNHELFLRASLAACTYAELFSDRMKTDEDKTFLRIFGERGMITRRRWKKAFYPYRLKPSVLEEVALRFAFLCGRV